MQFGISGCYNISTMNIQNLRYFAIVAKLENVTKAAELMHTSQSAVSKNILALEDEFGVNLFDRFGKKLVLNDAGRRFLQSCEISFAKMRKLLGFEARFRRKSYHFDTKDDFLPMFGMDVAHCSFSDWHGVNCVKQRNTTMKQKMKKGFTLVEIIPLKLSESDLIRINDQIVFIDVRQFGPVG